MRRRFTWLAVIVCFTLTGTAPAADGAETPHIIFVMADDQGWGQTGYYDHPVLKTPHLDEMAAHGLRFDRFYAGAPNCSPTRATVMTGRTHDRAGVLNHGYALRLQEKTISQALKEAGYVTAHFGKWHLNGHRGPGAPILKDDPRSPSAFGFDEWVSVTNFFDLDPLMSRNGKVEQLYGDSSEVIVEEAIDFLKKHREGGRPTFSVIWYGTPHSPFKALERDKADFSELDETSANHYGELVAMDRSIGTLRAALRELGIAENTLLIFCSDNGGLPRIEPETVGGLRGFKGSVYEGGLRVPAVIEWPGAIEPRVTDYPAATMDLFPTVAEVVGLPEDALLKPLDGISLVPLFTEDLTERGQPLGFRHTKRAAWIDNRYKLVTQDVTEGENGTFELYDLLEDPRETTDLSSAQPEVFARLKTQLLAWNDSVDASFAGKDYPEGTVSPPDPEPEHWYLTEPYQPYLEQWKDRWEFKTYIERRQRAQRRNR
jgi:arylsulfatase A-like enzyme